MSDALVSVGVPVYGPLRRIDRAVRSVLAQSHENLEVILCDPGLDQEAASLMEQLLDADPRIKVVREARRRTLIQCCAEVRSIASGTYSMWLDGGHWLDPRYLEIASEFLDHNPAHVLAHGTTVQGDSGAEAKAVSPAPAAFEDPSRRDERMISNLTGSEAWYAVHRREVLADTPLHPALGFEIGWLVSAAWRGKVAALPEMRLFRYGPPDAGDVGDRIAELGVGNFQATDPWLATEAALFCNIAYFDQAMAQLPLTERARLAAAAADTVAQRWRVMDESMLISFAARMFPSDAILERFRTLRTTMADAVLGLRSVSSADLIVQSLIGTINVLCRMRIGNIPLTKEDRDIVRQIEVLWDSDQAVGSQNKVAIVSAMYL